MQLTRKHLIELGLTTDDKVIYDDYPIRVQVTDTTADDGRPPEVFTWWAAGRLVDPSPQTLEEAAALLNKKHPALAPAVNGGELHPVVELHEKKLPANELDPGLSLDGGGEGS